MRVFRPRYIGAQVPANWDPSGESRFKEEEEEEEDELLGFVENLKVAFLARRIGMLRFWFRSPHHARVCVKGKQTRLFFRERAFFFF